jgi:membrane-bound serine protease (ClpP class)
MPAVPAGASSCRTNVLSIWCVASAVVAALLALPLQSTRVAAAERAVVLEIDGAIGPAITDYVVRELRDLKPSETRLVIIRMNTPGGLDTSMREIIRAILASPIPQARSTDGCSLR